MLMTFLKHMFQNPGKGQEAAKGASVCALHCGKMTGIMASILRTLETNDIDRVNRAKSHIHGVEGVKALF